MINKKFGKDLFLVILSNGVKLLSSLLTVFIIPLIFNQQDYGFYKLFLLYVSYVGIFHFGFNDGIYLYYAGKDYEQLDKTRFRTYTKFLTIVQTIIALIVISLSFFLSGDRQIILMLVGVNLIVLNLTTYYQFISQVTQRFKEFAIRNIIFTVLNAALIALFYFLNLTDYKLFLVFVVLINIVLLLWYVISYRDITFGKANKFKEERHNIVLMFKLGILLMASNLVVMFFSSIPRQYVDYRYPVEIYPDIFSNFSFAYTLMGFTGVFLSAISLVIYPTLRKASDIELREKYNDLKSIVIALVFLLIIAYYPLAFIVQRWLPNYTNALDIFFVLAPGIAISSSVSVIIHNYYKSLNKNKEFLIIGILSLLLLIVAIYIINTFINDNVIYIAITTVVVQFIWYLATEFYLTKKLKVNPIKNIIYIIISAIIFYSIGLINNQLYAFLLYGLSIVVFTLIFFGRNIKDIINNIKSKKDNAIETNEN
ncbi:MAG: lipopolysaccharide biosynthesis protein [Acholeplasmatales bacterium]